MDETANNEESIENLMDRRKRENEAFQKILNAIKIKGQVSSDHSQKQKPVKSKRKENE